MTVPDSRCANERHTDAAPDATNLITLPSVGQEQLGFPVCDSCLLAYTRLSYLRGARLAFTVRPL